MLEENVLVKLQKLHIHHVMIQTELKTLIKAKAV